MRILIIVFLFIATTVVTAQSVNDYKYVLVADQYDFQKSENSYRLNEFMAFELKKYGFDTYRLSESLPEDLNQQRCKALSLKIEESGLLKSKMVASLENCFGKVLFTTKVGQSKAKSFDRAYMEAVRSAFKSFEELNYVYNGGNLKADPIKIIEESNTDAQNAQLPKVADSKPKPLNDDHLQEPREVLRTFDYEGATSEEYALKFDDAKETFQLFQHGAAVGSGRKSAAGVYLVTTDAFTGIGFIENDQFIIEYDESGTTKRITLIK